MDIVKSQTENAVIAENHTAVIGVERNILISLHHGLKRGGTRLLLGSKKKRKANHQSFAYLARPSEPPIIMSMFAWKDTIKMFQLVLRIGSLNLDVPRI